jgi:uncharacterized tellurite resistance protein B-like protein
MHIILALAGAIITILILLRKLGDAGITLDSINPFAWHRRHQWRKKYHSKPLFNIEDPLKAAALMIVAVAKADGDISLEEKQHILKLFEQEFGFSAKEAAGLFTSSVFFLKDEVDISSYVSRILEPSSQRFSEHQITFTVECMKQVAGLVSDHSESKNLLIRLFSEYFQNNHNH